MRATGSKRRLTRVGVVRIESDEDMVDVAMDILVDTHHSYIEKEDDCEDEGLDEEVQKTEKNQENAHGADGDSTWARNSIYTHHPSRM